MYLDRYWSALLWAVFPLVHHPKHEISEYTLTINWVWSNISPTSAKAAIFNCGNCVLSAVCMYVCMYVWMYDVLRTLLQAVATCRLDYCNSLLVGLPACDISRLQSVQNAAGRLLGGISRFDTVDHVFRDDLHWLPFKQRIIFKVEVLGYKAIHSLRLLTWRNCLFPCQVYRHWVETDLHLVGTSSFHSQQETPLTVNEVFAVAGPTWWNYFPLEIRNSSSMQTFRSTLKTFWFREPYNISAS